MLFNPLWKKPTKVANGPFALQSLIAWLETKDPKEEYNYTSPTNCLLSQYFRAMGFVGVIVTPYDIAANKNGLVHTQRLPSGFDRVALGHAGCFHTFGAALKRAKKLAA